MLDADLLDRLEEGSGDRERHFAFEQLGEKRLRYCLVKVMHTLHNLPFPLLPLLAIPVFLAKYCGKVDTNSLNLGAKIRYCCQFCLG